MFLRVYRFRPWLMILALRPMRAFLSTIARSITELAPMPSGGRFSRWFSSNCVLSFGEVDPHDVSVANRHVFADPRPDADH